MAHFDGMKEMVMLKASFTSKDRLLPHAPIGSRSSGCGSRAGCRRTRRQVLARDSRDPVGGIERSEGPHESAAAIGCNHWHDVHVVAKKVYTCSKHGVGLANGMQSLPHEIANGCLKG